MLPAMPASPASLWTLAQVPDVPLPIQPYQQLRGQLSSPPPSVRDPEAAAGTGLQPWPMTPVVAIWAVYQRMEDFSLFVSLSLSAKL